MGVYNEFPHTNFYNQDLGFLICSYKKLTENQEDLNKKYDLLMKIYENVKENIKYITIEQLQEWLEDGTLRNLINNELGLITVFDTTEEMLQATNLTVGQTIKTNGYYSINDGGGAVFVIKNTSTLLSLDLQNDLKAEFTNEIISPKMLGGKKSEDISSILNTILNFKDVLFLDDEYKMNITINKNIEIYGNEKTKLYPNTTLNNYIIDIEGNYNFYIHDLYFDISNNTNTGCIKIFRDKEFMQYENNKSFRIENISIKHNLSDLDLIKIQNFSSVTLDNIDIKGTYPNNVGNGITILGGINNKINNIYCSYLEKALLLKTEDINLEGFEINNIIFLTCKEGLAIESLNTVPQIISIALNNGVIDQCQFPIKNMGCKFLYINNSYLGLKASDNCYLYYNKKESNTFYGENIYFNNCTLFGRQNYNNYLFFTESYLYNVNCSNCSIYYFSNFNNNVFLQKSNFNNCLLQLSISYINTLHDSNSFYFCNSQNVLSINNVISLKCKNISVNENYASENIELNTVYSNDTVFDKVISINCYDFSDSNCYLNFAIGASNNIRNNCFFVGGTGNTQCQFLVTIKPHESYKYTFIGNYNGKISFASKLVKNY